MEKGRAGAAPPLFFDGLRRARPCLAPRTAILLFRQEIRMDSDDPGKAMKLVGVAAASAVVVAALVITLGRLLLL